MQTDTATPPPASESSSLTRMLELLRPEEPGDMIGGYELVSNLGEGGFGIVWHALQRAPVRREVALKILKLGLDSAQIIGRFEQEEQALALLDHPGIAKVYDAGATLTGRLYFAMELIRGEPITEHCDDHHFSPRERLELMLRVCSAVQHAHQKAVIHRDLKPTNVLVTVLNDGSSCPKIIDFGLAKATSIAASEHALIETAAETMIGTPLYMSPEQADGSPDVDTRTDIYSLGVLLYELLTGRTPHDPDSLNHCSNEDVRRAIREVEPPPPSYALRGLSEGALLAVAQQRGTLPEHLIFSLRGDLDAICQKALEKDPRRRYASAAALAADLQHHLLHEPIAARPPSRGYRTAKFIRRHTIAVFASLVVLLSIVFGAVISFREAVKARAAEKAEASLREGADRLRRRAQLNEYVADLGLAQQSLLSGNLGRAADLLGQQRQANDEGDLRGWGWRYLWNLAQGAPHRDLADHSGPAHQIAFSPDGRFLAVGGLTAVTIRTYPAGNLVASLPVGARSMGFLAGGQYLVTMNAGTIHLWRTDDWTEYASWEEGPGPLAISANGMHVAIAVENGVRVRAAGDWHEERFLPGARGPLVFGADARMLATDSDSGLELWVVSRSEPLHLQDSAGIFTSTDSPHFMAASPMAFTIDGSALIAVQNHWTAGGIYYLRAWETKRGQEIASIPHDPDGGEHKGAIASLSVSPDGRHIATASLDHSVRLWDWQLGKQTALLGGHRGEVGGSAFTPDGSHLITCDRSGKVKEWSVDDRPSDRIYGDALDPLGFSIDGRQLGAIQGGRSVVLYNAATLAPERTLPLAWAVGKPVLDVIFSASRGVLAQVLAQGEIQLTHWPEERAEVLHTGVSALDFIAFTPGGRDLIYGSRQEPVRVRNLESGLETTLPFPAARAGVSPDGRILAAFVPNATSLSRAPGPAAPSTPAKPPSHAFLQHHDIVLWDLTAGRQIARLPGGPGSPLCFAFSHDGKYFAAAGTDDAIRIWRTDTGALLGTCQGHKQFVRAIAFSPDGTEIASASEDSTWRLWNVETQREILSFEQLGGNMTGLRFSPDGQALVIAHTERNQGSVLEFLRAPQVPSAPR